MRVFHGLSVFCVTLALSAVAGCGGSEAGPDDATAATTGGTAAPATTEASDEEHPQVTLETTHGRITLELDAHEAPATVRNFLTYVENGHYDGTLFHQVEQGYVMLGGGYSENLSLKSAQRPIRNEATNGLKNTKGTIAMARSADAIHSSTCQFFINLADNPQLDHQELTAEGFGYCVFGRVVEGWDVIDAIAQVPVKESDEFTALPTETVMIRSAKRVR